MQISFGSPYPSNKIFPRSQQNVREFSPSPPPSLPFSQPIVQPAPHFGGPGFFKKRIADAATRALLDSDVLTKRNVDDLVNLIKNKGANLYAKHPIHRHTILENMAQLNVLPAIKAILDSGVHPTPKAFKNLIENNLIDAKAVKLMLVHGVDLTNYNLERDIFPLLDTPDSDFSTIVKNLDERERWLPLHLDKNEQNRRRKELKETITAYQAFQKAIPEWTLDWEKHIFPIFSTVAQKYPILYSLKVDPLDNPSLKPIDRLGGFSTRDFTFKNRSGITPKSLLESVKICPSLKFLHPKDNPRHSIVKRLQECLDDPTAFRFFHNWYGFSNPKLPCEKATKQLLKDTLRLAQAESAKTSKYTSSTYHSYRKRQSYFNTLFDPLLNCFKRKPKYQW